MDAGPLNSNRGRTESLSKRKVLLDGDHRFPLSGTQETAKEHRSSRRGALGGALITVTSLLGVSTVSAAGGASDSEVAQQAAAAYNSEPDVRSAVRKYASGLLQVLADRDLLDSPTVSALPVSELYSSSMDAYFAAEEGAIVFGTVENGEPRTRIEIKTRLPDGRRLVVVVKPQVGKSYAVLPDWNGAGSVRSLSVSETSDGVTTQSCDCYDSATYCGYSCIEGRCQCVEFNDGSHCMDGQDGQCDKCWTEDDCSSCFSEDSC